MAGDRIRYVDHKFRPGCKISGRAFASTRTGAKYRVVIDPENMQYFVRNERTKEFVKKSRIHKNMNVLKREAREDLESLGVQFKRESRDRTFGVKPRGYDQNTHEKAMRQKAAENKDDEL